MNVRLFSSLASSQKLIKSLDIIPVDAYEPEDQDKYILDNVGSKLLDISFIFNSSADAA